MPPGESIGSGGEREVVLDRVRSLPTRKLPETMRGEIPFFGDVIIYLVRTCP